ncbi:MAG: hypothetical protein E7299_05270 [Lachnospiraceae bacterium]|nr:hypothetical protein [Lachnospiraceae bacterium]
MAYIGINQYAGIQSSYLMNNIRTVDVETVRRQDQQKVEESSKSQTPSSTIHNAEADKLRAQRVAKLEDISLSFRQNDDYGYIGKDSNLENLDMQKAISDMQKDSILQDYQYFVGSSNVANGGLLHSMSEDGIVLLK